MSEEEKLSAIGQLMTERSEIKSQMDYLENSLRRTGEGFASLGDAMKRNPWNPSRTIQDLPFVNLTEVRSACDNYGGLRKKLAEIEKRLHEEGIKL